MRLNYLVIAISILCGAIFWIADTIFDYSYYRDQISFLNLLINNVPNHEVHLRPVVLICFLVFGFFVSQVLTKARKTELALIESQRKLQDQNDRKQAETSLEREKERLAVTLRSIGDGVIATDTEGNILLINKVAEEFTGWTEKEAIGKKLDEVFCIVNEDTRKKHENPVNRVLRTEKVVELDLNTVLIAKDKTERIIDDSISPVRDQDGNIIGVVIVFHEITDNRKITLDLQRIDKLESVSMLAGGIAHDFNNALMAIMGNISLAMTNSDLEKIRKKLIDAERACLRARDLTKQLLIFSKGGVPIKKTELISDFIKESVIFALSGANVRADFQIPDDLLPMKIDDGLMNQVINNLVINAAQTMPEGGKVKVYAENLDINDDSGLPLKAGKYMRMSFEDHGIGISKENLKRIFNPYFTTKQKGRELGLAESFSIAREHDGYITVESTVGVGTTFHVYLPVSPKALPIKKADTIEELIKGEGRILVMDDEKYVRDIVAEMLSNLGYKVTTAIDGFDVIQQYLQAKMDRKPYDLVILDLIVPGSIGGLEAIQKLKKIDPQVKAIVSSAYANDPIMANFNDYGFNGVIPKAYKIKELSEVMYKVMKR